MTKRLREYGKLQTRVPKARIAADSTTDGYFYAGEAARILGLDELDYQQVRRLFVFVREQSGTPLQESHERRWARFTIRDLACMEALVELCGGKEALKEGRRLRIQPVRRACTWLREQGVTNPLLQVPMIRTGDQVFVVLHDTVIQLASGQLVLEGMIELVSNHLGNELDIDRDLLAAIDAERALAASSGVAASSGRQTTPQGPVRVHLVPTRPSAAT